MSNEILVGDAVIKLHELEVNSCNLIFADPPYNVGYAYDEYKDNLPPKEYVAWCKRWIAECYRCLKGNGSFWLAIGDEYAAQLKLAAEANGFITRSWVIWYYTFGVNCSENFSRSHSHLFHFVKDVERCKFNAENPAVRVASARQVRYNDKRANPLGRLPDNTWILVPPQEMDTLEQDTWHVPRINGTFKERRTWHTTQIPEKILERIILLCSDEGDLVVDPFSGSGTTSIVAKRLHRNSVAFDISQNYVERALEELAKA